MNKNLELLKISTAGSVDDGKSTLIARLLYEANAIFNDQLDSVKKYSQKKGLEQIELAYLLDGLEAEREQGITIDVAYRYFTTKKRKFIIADCPGHEEYTRNMVTGVSNSDLAILLVDAKKGLQTQSKRHLFITSLLETPQILMVVNKMDLVDYKEERYEEIKEEFLKFSSKLKIQNINFLPAASISGEMIKERGENMNWYKGLNLFDYLESVNINNRNLIDFRLPIQTVIRPNQDFRGYAGKIEGGSIKKGEKIIVLPSLKKSTIENIFVAEKKVEKAFNPQSVLITLEDEIGISRGDMIVKEENLPQINNHFEGNICWFSNKSLETNKRYLIKHLNTVTSCYISKLSYKFDVNNISKIENEKVKLNDIARVSIQTNKDLIYDVYSKNRNTGSFIIIDEFSKNTVAAGMILSKGKKENLISNNNISEQGSVLWFTGLSGSGKSTISEELEKYLKKQGKKVQILDGDIVRENLCKDLGFSEEDRRENIKRVSFLAKMLAKHGVTVLCSFISPFSDQRENLKKEIDNFYEIYLSTPLKTCEERDIKGLYKEARNGKIKNFTGIDSPYQKPKNPDLEIDTSDLKASDSLEIVIKFLQKNKII